jgi:hypothetical protein
MPVATISEQPKRFDLKSLPGAYVVIRRLTYGETLARGAINSKVNFDVQNKKDMQGFIDMANEKTTMFEWANAIVEHNLTDERERPLNFKNPVDVKAVQGVIGGEISAYIMQYNNFDNDGLPEDDTEDDLGN